MSEDSHVMTNVEGPIIREGEMNFDILNYKQLLDQLMNRNINKYLAHITKSASSFLKKNELLADDMASARASRHFYIG